MLDLTLRFLCRQCPQAMGFSSLSASPPVASLSVICSRAISDALYRDSMVSGGLVDRGDPTAKHLLDPASEVSLSDGALTLWPLTTLNLVQPHLLHLFSYPEVGSDYFKDSEWIRLDLGQWLPSSHLTTPPRQPLAQPQDTPSSHGNESDLPRDHS